MTPKQGNASDDYWRGWHDAQRNAGMVGGSVVAGGPIADPLPKDGDAERTFHEETVSDARKLAHEINEDVMAGEDEIAAAIEAGFSFRERLLKARIAELERERDELRTVDAERARNEADAIALALLVRSGGTPELVARLRALIEYKREDGTTGFLYPGGADSTHKTIREAADALERLSAPVDGLETTEEERANFAEACRKQDEIDRELGIPEERVAFAYGEDFERRLLRDADKAARLRKAVADALASDRADERDYDFAQRLYRLRRSLTAALQPEPGVSTTEPGKRST